MRKYLLKDRPCPGEERGKNHEDVLYVGIYLYSCRGGLEDRLPVPQERELQVQGLPVP